MLDTSHLLILGAVALGYLVYRSSQQDSGEPPSVSGSIPVIGHMLGMLKGGLGYFGTLGDKYPDLPIFLADMFFTKFYVVTSPELLQAAQRHRTLNFDSILDFSVSNMSGVKSEKTINLLKSKSTGGEGVANRVLHAMAPKLSGEGLDRMNLRMVKLLAPFLDQLGGQPTTDLYKWCRETITAASTDAVYGPLNPYKDEAVVDAWWQFDANLGPLLPNVQPWLFARKAWTAREKIVDAIVKYVESNGPEQGSELTKIRLKTTMDSGISVEEYARLEMTLLLALLPNSVPATFWMVFDICSRPQLLAEIRDEIALNALSKAADGTHIIDIASLRDRCPLLVSTYQEILRTRSTSVTLRSITKDTLLADKYTLKQGNMLLMAANQIGEKSKVWGSTANDFDPRRYMKSVPSQNGSEEKKDPRRPGGFMAFGIAPVICPGRHFASSEIVALAAMLVMRYDITPESGVWTAPERDPKALISSTCPIQGGFPVKVKTREAYEGVKWDFEVQAGKGQFPLSIG